MRNKKPYYIKRFRSNYRMKYENNNNTVNIFALKKFPCIVHFKISKENSKGNFIDPDMYKSVVCFRKPAF